MSCASLGNWEETKWNKAYDKIKLDTSLQPLLVTARYETNNFVIGNAK